jgi:hypothetical protein
MDLLLYDLRDACAFIAGRTGVSDDIVTVALFYIERYAIALGVVSGSDPRVRDELRARHPDLFTHERVDRHWRWPTEQAEFVHRETRFSRRLVAALMLAEAEYLLSLELLRPRDVEASRAPLAQWVAAELEDTQPSRTAFTVPPPAEAPQGSG